MLKRKLLIALAVAGLLTAAVGPSTLPAGAAAHVITLKLLTGQLLTVQLPDGVPCAPTSVPGAPAGAVVASCTEVPAQTTPATPSTASTPTTTTQQTAPTEAPKPGGAPRPQGTAPITAGGEKPKPRPKGKSGTTLGQPRADDVKPKRLPKGKTRASDGSPTIDNPTFSLADAGPAPIGVPNFFIEKFRIPPFLLPIYQAAGTQYGIPWQVLAAINEIETDYGRNLSVSSAGALGWMQFIPSSWSTYGVDANGDGKKDPYNPVDAIFAAARYLKAAGGDKDINKAIFAYNHADWYVQSVILRAKLIGGMPADLVGSLTGLTEGHFPVAARATYA
ncbi:MAG TPA: lytic transglycosylase domain-containing protein, partial [Solirubrobacteraceae bacterium]|nr:lytic transglycosylase domain-containing protein [Solirubrobacteraceae bacterium]